MDLSHELFPKRHWGVMAESETFAHLEHLRGAGGVERWDEDGMLIYRRRRAPDPASGTTVRHPGSLRSPHFVPVGAYAPLMTDDPTAEATSLLRHLIRNACVNDGTPESGEEIRSADLLTGYLGGTGLDLERYEPQPGRRSVLAKIEGTDPTAPTLLLMGHTDVVPVNPDGWQRDPFGGEIVDGEVWGRGAVDMLNLTATMAVAFRAARRLRLHARRARSSYLAVADEEALGIWGADWLVDHERDAVKADYVITESGGFQIPTADGPRLPVIVGEKGTYWSPLTRAGDAGPRVAPFRTDNALVTAAEVVRRLAEFQAPTEIHDTWRRFVAGARA